MNIDAMVKAGAEALAKRNSSSNVDSFMGISRAVVEAAIAAHGQGLADKDRYDEVFDGWKEDWK